MANLIIYILGLCIYNSILFYGKKLGINVILFVGPLLGFMYYVLKQNKKINNKKGLLFMIPIILLSIFYLVYDNTFFKVFNTFIMTILFLLMYLFTINPTFKISEVFVNVINLMFLPLSQISNLYRVVKLKIEDALHLSSNGKQKIKSIFIVIPIVIIVLLLLSSADMLFSNIFGNFFSLFKKISIGNIIDRIILIILLFTYLGSTINYLLYEYKEKKGNSKKESKIENYTIKLLLTTLNIIYVVFDFIQIRSLMFHQGLTNINYAEYARSGFFQLMFISIINLSILLISKKSKEDTKYNKIMSVIMVFLTFIIIVSSFLRMYMYESAYGYTLLRLLVYVTLLTEVILLIPTLVYIFNSKMNILKQYMIIIISIYTLLSLSPVDYFIAKNNINRFYKTGKIDVDYLKNYSTDNITLLCDLYDNMDDGSGKYSYTRKFLKDYLVYIYNQNKNNSVREYNFSRRIAIEKLKNYN